jgi:hypothetical protein
MSASSGLDLVPTRHGRTSLTPTISAIVAGASHHHAEKWSQFLTRSGDDGLRQQQRQEGLDEQQVLGPLAWQESGDAGRLKLSHLAAFGLDLLCKLTQNLISLNGERSSIAGSLS